MQQRVDAQLCDDVVAVVEAQSSTAAELLGRHGLVESEEDALTSQSLLQPVMCFFKVHTAVYLAG